MKDVGTSTVDKVVKFSFVMKTLKGINIAALIFKFCQFMNFIRTARNGPTAYGAN